MTFEFVLIALIDGQLPLELKRYEDASPLFCLEDASDANKYISNGYFIQHDIDKIKNIFMKNLAEYEAIYGRFLSYTPDALDLTTEASQDFYSDVYFAIQPSQSMERLDTMDMEQSLAFGRVAYSYERYVDANDENESNQIFKDILDNNELEDTSTMLKRDQVTYVCLPVPK